ncbi:hypothetical protein Poly59_00170 [Rubripirellula reticaptiva]|uniref:Uncharacterized protein n=1 Tax=Rubripirellula reticaptiva TaxID=2528013 RepID=A0A5C6F868_9BACT|nr:hypothetical protein Poly59_00170 [Rubripirellula reticaptiva]
MATGTFSEWRFVLFLYTKKRQKSGSLSAEDLQKFMSNVVANYDFDPKQITIIGYSAGSGSVTAPPWTKVT